MRVDCHQHTSPYARACTNVKVEVFSCAWLKNIPFHVDVFKAILMFFICIDQDRNQLGTPGRTKSFLRVGVIVKLCPNCAQHIFTGGRTV